LIKLASVDKKVKAVDKSKTAPRRGCGFSNITVLDRMVAPE
jgi:hypothetical protein